MCSAASGLTTSESAFPYISECFPKADSLCSLRSFGCGSRGVNTSQRAGRRAGPGLPPAAQHVISCVGGTESVPPPPNWEFGKASGATSSETLSSSIQHVCVCVWGVNAVVPLPGTWSGRHPQGGSSSQRPPCPPHVKSMLSVCSPSRSLPLHGISQNLACCVLPLSSLQTARAPGHHPRGSGLQALGTSQSALRLALLCEAGRCRVSRVQAERWHRARHIVAARRTLGLL